MRRRFRSTMQFKRKVKLAVCGLVAIVASSAVVYAQSKPLGVVELFTSQGCNSCPPADALFSELVEKGEVVALAYHVDYWDYLGWKDTLARPENTERQYGYMRSFGDRSIYTPQVVLNGRKDVNGTNRDQIEQGLAAFDKAGEGMVVGLTVSETDDSLIIRTEASKQPAAEAHLVLVFFDPPHNINIDQGENTGRQAIYLNAVSSVRTTGMWHGKVTEYELPKSEFAGKGGCAALLQGVGKDGAPGPILGAAIVRKP